MAAAETARLIASLELKDKMSPGLDKAVGKLGRLEGSLGRIGGIAQQGVGNAIRNIQRLALVGAVAVAGAVALGVRSLADLARTEAQTNAVIASTGGVAGQTSASVRKLSEDLENLSTVDDKVIQDGANMLLTFTSIGKDVFPEATKATLNLAVAMASGNVEQVDMKASAIQLGKALNDPIKGITALRRVGVAFTKAQIKQITALQESGDLLGAQKVILKELEVEFGNAAKAAGTGPEASWRRLQDVGEDLSQSLARGLLPVLERAATWLSTKLADPAVVRAIDQVGLGLAEAGTAAMDFLETVDFKSIGAGLQVAAGAAGTIVSAFMAMPEWVKIAVVSGWGLNKLTGGAVGGIIGELGKGLIRGVLGMNAGVVNINAGVVHGMGGPAGVAGAAKGGLGAVSKMFLVGEAIGLGLLVNWFREDQAARSTAKANEIAATQVQWLSQQPTKADLQSGLAAVEKGINDIQANPLNVLVQGEALDKLKQMRADLQARLSFTPGQSGGGSVGERDEKRAALEAGILQRAIAAGFKPTADQIQRTLENNLARIEENTYVATVIARENHAAIKDRDLGPAPVVNVTVVNNISAAQTNRATVIQRRFGPSGGSRERGPTEF